ncbi:MAG: sugar phosphate isomerase/epimerase [Spirochaetes bacterium]|nr:sugar phosphate isomerase/epimerase [Spirochaetota bacterium]
MKNFRFFENILLSCPSYIIPGTYLENIKYIYKNIEQININNIELLFYFIDYETLKLIQQEIKEILNYNGIFYFSIHLPDDIISNFSNIIELLNILKNLDISNIIIHSPGDQNFEYLNIFYNYLKELKKFIEKNNLNIENLLIENLANRDFSFVNSKDFEKFGLCLDVGHIYLKKLTIEEYLNENKIDLSRVKEIHFHGIKNGKDHSMFDDEIFKEVKYDFIKFIKKLILNNCDLKNCSDLSNSFEIYNTLPLKRIYTKNEYPNNKLKNQIVFNLEVFNKNDLFGLLNLILKEKLFYKDY